MFWLYEETVDEIAIYGDKAIDSVSVHVNIALGPWQEFSRHSLEL